MLEDILSENINTHRPVFEFPPVSSSKLDVQSPVALLKQQTATIYRLIYSNYLKMLFSRSSLTELINRCILSSSFPQLWKYSLIRPLSKILSPLSPADTRPTVCLPEPSKVLEWIIHQQLITYLESNNLLDPRQAGYRSEHDTQSALLGVIDNIRLGIEREQVTILVLLDFSNTFDSIPHHILLRKMREFNCRSSALSNRWWQKRFWLDSHLHRCTSRQYNRALTFSHIYQWSATSP